MFGTKALGASHEMVAQKWTMACDGADDRALAAIHTGCYGLRLTEGAIEQSLLRSPTYSCHRCNGSPLALTFFPDGDGLQSAQPLRVTGVRLDTWKRSEDGKGDILRLYNYHDTPRTASVHISGYAKAYTPQFRSMEFKTVRFDDQGVREVHLIDEN